MHIITVDGPSGAGKGTLSYALAKNLGFKLLDSGAIYRVCALATLQNNLDLNDDGKLAQLARELDLEFATINGEAHPILAGEDVNAKIRTQEVAETASIIASKPLVREALLQRQRDFATNNGLIADGRDMGTVVFPNAQVKFFLDASAEERAKRRLLQLQNKGINGSFTEILSEIKERDFRDRNRTVAPLKPASDAFLLDSTHLSIEEVIAQAMAIINQRLNHG